MDSDRDHRREPLVSVVMPTYQRMTYLREALESGLAQTWRNLEIIVSDNGASEELQALLKSYDDPRIRYRTNGVNVGPMRNAYNAYVDGRGEFLATLHDDDVWEPTFLETLTPPLVADPSLSLAFSDIALIDETGSKDDARSDINTELWGRKGLATGVHRPFRKLATVDRAVPVAMSTVFRKSAIDWEDFPDEMNPAYDLWIGYLASRDGSGAYYCAERLTRYREHRSSLTAARRYDKALVYCYDRMIADPQMADVRSELMRESSHFRRGYALEVLREGDRRTARRLLRDARSAEPDSRTMVATALAYAPRVALEAVESLRARRRSTDPTR